ncbi:hypothetical protein N665_1355s0003 [Sinapis alba]|nr:hypothetical protein N665_1355s0003 [Sinapis alba]
MSSGGNSTPSTAPAVEKMFFCYQCNRTVTISISSTADPFCPLCSGGFLEEHDEPIPNPPPNLNPSGSFFPMADPFSTFLPLLFGSSAPPSSTAINQSFFGPSMNTRSTQNQPQGNAFDPFSFLQNHLQHLQSSGTQVQFVIEDHPLDLSNRMPGHPGDYFFGPGLEQLIQQLAENDPNRYGTPPASKSAIDGLPTVKVSKEDTLKSEMNQCAVCMDEFEDGSDVKQMPCKHVFHQDCLMPWLQLHNSCPVCRYELPTDDPDYESRGQGQGGQTSGNGQGLVEGQQTTPRRFSVQLPWPFGRQEGSGSGAPGSGGGGGSNLETRQDDLD